MLPAKEKSRQRALSGFLRFVPNFGENTVIANDIVVTVSARCFIVGKRRKTQVILYVLPSIFARAGGKTAVENVAKDGISDYKNYSSAKYLMVRTIWLV